MATVKEIQVLVGGEVYTDPKGEERTINMQLLAERARNVTEARVANLAAFRKVRGVEVTTKTETKK